MSNFRLTYVDVEMRKKDYDLCCEISTKLLNGDIFRETSISIIWNKRIYIGPLQLTWTWFCHILINPSGSWKSSLTTAMTNNFVVLDYFYMSLKFDNNILLGTEKIRIRSVSSLSLLVSLQNINMSKTLCMVSQSTLKFAWSLWLKCNSSLSSFTEVQ